VHVAAFVQGKHLMNRDAREPFSSVLQRVDDRHRFAVAEPDDQVGAFPEVVEYALGRTMLLGERSRYVRRPVRRRFLHNPSHPVRSGRSPADMLPESGAPRR